MFDKKENQLVEKARDKADKEVSLPLTDDEEETVPIKRSELERLQKIEKEKNELCIVYEKSQSEYEESIKQTEELLRVIKHIYEKSKKQDEEIKSLETEAEAQDKSLTKIEQSYVDYNGILDKLNAKLKRVK